MFCHLEGIELNVETCFVVECLYRSSVGKCAYTELFLEDGASAPLIAEIKGQKLYKIKSHAVSSKESIEVGLVIDKYADYIKDSFPSMGDLMIEGTVGTQSDPVEETPIARVLRKVFRLTYLQQLRFWEEERYADWQARHNVQVTLSQISVALKSVSSQYA